MFELKPAYTGNTTRLISGGKIVQSPAGVVLDAAYDLFVADYSAGYVYEFAPPYTGNPKATTPGLGLPEGVTLDSSGNLFVADISNNAVDEFASPYTGAPKVTIGDGNSSGLDGPTDLAFDPGANLYVTNYGNIYAAQKTINDTITAYAPPFTSSEPIGTLANSLDGPAGLAFHTTYSIAVK